MIKGFLKANIAAVICAAFFLGGCGTRRGNEEQAVAIQLEPQTDAAEPVRTGGAEAEEPSAPVYVHICGAVHSPGVYAVAADSRLFEVVALAGGLMPEADEASLNLAHTVTDGQQIVVRTKEETARLAEKGLSGAPEQGQADGLVNINTASLAELTAISGIGESRAQAIIAYRERSGGFRTIEDIKKVDGIKDGLFSKIKDKITV